MNFAVKLRPLGTKHSNLGDGMGARGFANRQERAKSPAKSPAPASSLAPSPRRGQSAALQTHTELPWRWFLGLLLLHVILACLMKRLPLLASLHAALTLLAALILVLRNAPPVKVVATMAYLIGSEVLWRMTQASVPWEFGKYAVALIALVAIARQRIKSPNWLSVLYFSLLVPSAFLTLGSGDLNQVRQDISFNLSGPFSLAVLMFYLSSVRLRFIELKRVFQFLLLPLVGVCSIASFTVLTNENIVFDDRSNTLASGGAPANQVSAVLGLAVFIALLYSFSPGQAKTKRVFLQATAVFFLAQCVMTFSRTGLYLAAISMVVVMLMLSHDVKLLLAALGGVCLLALVISFVVWPALDRYTGGALAQRFEKTTSTGRDEIVMGDLKLFIEHPLLGVGVGRAREERRQFIGHVTNAHTEFSRLLAEHGCLGLLALLLLLLMAGGNVWRERFSYRGAVVAGAVVWSLLFMLVSGMRLAVPSFLLGLSCVRLINPKEPARRSKIIKPL